MAEKKHVHTTKKDWVQKKLAEGFSVEYAERSYNSFSDPTIKEAQKQKVPTKVDVVVNVEEARNNNPNRAAVYKPDFSLTKEYLDIKAKLDAMVGVTPYDPREAEKLSSEMLHIKMYGTITGAEREAEVNKTLEMPISKILSERKKYAELMEDYAEKIDNFDLDAVQAEADAIEAKYASKMRGNTLQASIARAEYHKEVDALVFEKIKKPLNDLKVKRWEAKEFFLIYEARVKFYVNANKAIIEDEIMRARHEEVRGSLAELADYIESAYEQ